MMLVGHLSTCNICFRCVSEFLAEKNVGECIFLILFPLFTYVGFFLFFRLRGRLFMPLDKKMLNDWNGTNKPPWDQCCCVSFVNSVPVVSSKNKSERRVHGAR